MLMRHRLFVLASALLVFAVGCAPSATETTEKSDTPERGTFKIALIAKSSTNPVFLAAKKGAEDAAKELSRTEGMTITVDWLTPPREDGQEQAQRIAQAVNSGADAVLIACSDAGKVTGAIDDAVAKGVPVMTFDSDAPASKRFSYFGAEDPEVGKEVMRELATLIGGRGEVAILAGNQNAPNLRRRVEGVLAEAKKYSGVNIVGTFYHAETPQDAAAEVKRAMQANPRISGWAMVGGWPLFTQTLLTDLDPSKVKIVAVDCLPAQMPYVERGIAPVLLAQPIYDWGRVGVETIVRKVIRKESVPEMNRMQLVRVDATTLGAWAQQLVDWGFTDVDPKYLANR